MYDENKAKRAVTFINALKHTKGKWRGVPFELLPWQDKIINDVFGKGERIQTIQHSIC